jgi:hypothetical protein
VKNIFLFGIIFLSLVFARRDCLQQAELDALGRSIRPEKDTLAISPSGHFYIHFDTTGNAAPDLTDSDSNGVPDYIDEVGIIADSAHHVLVDIMGWEEEPFDGEGGYDIYIMSYGAGVYGYNYKDNGNTSYLQIDNDYVGYNSKFDLTPIEIMRITVAHEYFHGIQWGYEENLGSNKYFYEMTSMWFEDVLIPDGNDYLDGWADPLLDNPTADFDNTGGGYELALFGHYLSSFLDSKGIETAKNSTIIREMWERYGSTSDDAFSSVKYVLENNYDVSFIEAWVDFISRNLYNGIYTNMGNPFYYYIDQSIADPIHTSTNLLPDSVEFVLELDDESVAIESFRIGSMESLITIDHGDLDFTGRVTIISTDNYEYNNLFWGSDTTVEESFNNAEVHFVYGIDGSSTTLPIEITAHTVPMPPLNLMAVVAQDSIILSWNSSRGPGDNLSYVVFRDNDSIDYVLNDTNYVDKNIEGGQSYTYKVTCRNTVGESSASNTISIMSWPDEENVISSTIMNIYPNPIRQSQELTILYALDSDYTKPIVNLINVRGEVVNSIKLSSFSKGWHRENINSILNTNPSNGIYFISLQPDQESRHTKKIAILN